MIRPGAGRRRPTDAKGIAMDRRSPEIMVMADAVADADAFSLPSRAAALGACREALAGRGPILVTGAAGVGKTWLIGRLIEGSPLGWVAIDAAPDMTAADLLSTLAGPLRVSRPQQA